MENYVKINFDNVQYNVEDYYLSRELLEIHFFPIQWYISERKSRENRFNGSQCFST